MCATGRFYTIFISDEGVPQHSFPCVEGLPIDITQISVGSCSQHVLVKDSQNSIFVMGNNGRGQLGKNCSLEILSPQEMNSSKWGNIKNCAAKSARK